MKRYLYLILLPPAVMQADNYRLEAGIKTTAYDYTETEASAILDTEDSGFGDILGGYGRLQLSLWDHDYDGEDSIELYGAHTEGETRYIGSIFGSGDPYGSEISTTENIYDDFQLSYLRNFDRAPLEYAVAAGIGYYEWQRTLSTLQSETYHWFYARLHTASHYTFANRMKAGIELEGRYAFEKEIDVEMPLYTGTLQLGNTYTLIATIPLSIPITEGLDVVTRLQYESTTIGHSNADNGVYEPDSEQENWHFYFGLGLHY